MKWLIPDPGRPGGDTRRSDEEYWRRAHVEDDYAGVFSVTEDADLQARIIETIESRSVSSKNLRILVPGCGSRMALERRMAMEMPRARIVGTDFAPVINMINSREGRSPAIVYEARDSRRLGYDSEFDFAVVVNSILSDSDRDNRMMISSIHGSLKEGGWLVGLFPTVFATVDIAQCEPSERWREDLYDLTTSRYYEESQFQSQIFYTPLRLRAILRETGFEELRVELFFCDSEPLLRESSRIYGLGDPDLVLYELLLVARKPSPG